MTKYIKLAFIIIPIVCILVLIVCLTFSESGETYTNDINDYCSDKYPVYSPLFLDELPSNARVVAFHYYADYGDEQDIYLELKFSDLDDMEFYISKIKTNIVENSKDTYFESNGDFFLEEKNPYNMNYTDLFCSSEYVLTNDKCFSGYEIEYLQKERFIHSFYALISYSLEELTVIQTCSGGSFFTERYIPKYFERFDIPLNNEMERYKEVNWEDKKQKTGDGCVFLSPKYYSSL